jgi:hypothetical protein
MKYHLAQINIAKFKASLEDRSMKEFVDFLEPVNKFAEESEGFVWRLKDDEGRAVSYIENPFKEEELLAINMSVWSDVEHFKTFVYKSVHSYFLKNQKQWFTPIDRPRFAMWWVPEGYTPTIVEGKQKIDQIEKEGPSTSAFTFQKFFDHNGKIIS